MQFSKPSGNAYHAPSLVLRMPGHVRWGAGIASFFSSKGRRDRQQRHHYSSLCPEAKGRWDKSGFEELRKVFYWRVLKHWGRKMVFMTNLRLLKMTLLLALLDFALNWGLLLLPSLLFLPFGMGVSTLCLVPPLYFGSREFDFRFTSGGEFASEWIIPWVSPTPDWDDI